MAMDIQDPQNKRQLTLIILMQVVLKMRLERPDSLDQLARHSRNKPLHQLL